MADPLLVRGLERLRNLLRDRQRLIDRDGALCDALREIVALDQFHHEGGDAPALFEAVDRGDVGMIQRGEDFRLALETGHRHEAETPGRDQSAAGVAGG